MKGIQALREERGAKAEEYRSILDQNKGKLTKAETVKLDALEADIIALDDRIDRHDKALEMEAEKLFGQGGFGQQGMRNGFSLPGRGVRLLKNSESVSRPNMDEPGGLTLADIARRGMNIEAPRNAMTSSDSTVPLHISSEIIDAVRAASRVIQAGAGTIMIDGPTNLAKIVTAPTVYQHTQGSPDISTSDLVLAPVALDPKSLVAAVPLSVELVEDSKNLDEALRMSLGAAFAAKLDSLCLATILADSAIPTNAVGRDPANWVEILDAVGDALAVNQGLPLSLVGNTMDYAGRAKGSTVDGNWLLRPPVLEGMQDLFTTKIATGTAVFGDFYRGFAIASRQELRFEVVRWAGIPNATHCLVAYARMDGVVLQPKHLFIQKKTV